MTRVASIGSAKAAPAESAGGRMATTTSSSSHVCPLCGSGRAERTKQIDTQQIVSTWQRQFQIDVSDQLGGCTAVQVHLCASCDLRFFKPDATAGAPALYEQLQRHDWYYPNIKWEHQVALRSVKASSRVLDVGCGRGDFLALAAQRDPQQLMGLEINPAAVSAARRSGLNVLEQDVCEHARERPGAYDVVTSFQVLEHVTNPMSFLAAQCRLARRGGRVIVGLPNADSFLGRQFNVLDMPPHHMTRWTYRTLRKLPSLLPLDLQRVRREPLARCHVGAFVSTYGRWVADRVNWRLADPRLMRSVAALTTVTGLRNALRGQSIYACYTRR